MLKYKLLFFGHLYIHNLTPFSHGGRWKLQNATCYNPYILLSPRPHSYIRWYPYQRGGPRRTYIIDLIGEVLQKGQMRSTHNRRACMIRCMNVEIYITFIFSYQTLLTAPVSCQGTSYQWSGFQRKESPHNMRRSEKQYF